MEPPKNEVCPECRYRFIGPIPHFCPRCDACLHGSTVGTETRSITVTFRSSGEGTDSEDGGPPRKCATCNALIIGPAVDGCPACGRPLETVAEALPRILEVEAPLPDETASAGAPEKRPARARRFRGGFAVRLWRNTIAGLRQSPCWILSLGLHVLFFLFMTQLVFMMNHVPPDEAILLSLYDSIGPNEGPGDGEDDENEGTIPEEPEDRPEPLDEEVTEPLPAPEASPAPGPESPQEKKGDVGLGRGESSGGAGKGVGPFRNRVGAGRGEALRRYGGNSRSEAAVAKGLEWLNRHQDPRGNWSGSGFRVWCRDDACGQGGTSGYDVGHTGLALLCFLGSGYTHRKGRYTGTVGDGLTWLLTHDVPLGHPRPVPVRNLYNHAIYCLALAEAYGMTRDPRLRAPLERGIAVLAAAQQTGGGWDYTAQPSGRCDVSVSGWVIMALRSAGAAGVPISREAWTKAMGCLRRMSRSDGQVDYEDRGYRGRSRWIRRGPGMAAVGLLCHLYFGDKPDATRVRKIVDHLRGHPPRLKSLREEKLHTNYYWYYATLALFMVGGDDWYWWNEHLRDLVVGLQCTSGCAEGSWDAEDGWMAPYGGRLYATCMNLLSLEVYYRYLPLTRSQGEPPFLTKEDVKPLPARAAPPPPDPVTLAQNPAASSGRRLEAIRALEKTKEEKARKALERLLDDSNAAIRWQAIKSLGARGDRASVPALLKVLATAGDDLLPTTLRALGRLGGKPALRALVPFLTHGEERVRSRALQALRSATGRKEGMNPERWEEIVETGDF